MVSHIFDTKKSIWKIIFKSKCKHKVVHVSDNRNFTVRKTPLYPATICLRWPKIRPQLPSAHYSGGILSLNPRVTLAFNIVESEGKPRVSANTLGFRCLGIPPQYSGRIFGHLSQIVAGYSGVLRSNSKLCGLKKWELVNWRH
jgi:hypothetical protein